MSIRKQTVERLFDGDYNAFVCYRTTQFENGVALHMVTIREKKVNAIIVEYPLSDGFEVYVATPGNSLREARVALGVDR